MINKTQEVDKLEDKASKMKEGPEKEHQLRAVEYRNIQLQAIFVVDTMLMTYIGKISVQLADLYSTAKSSAQQLAVISRAQKELEKTAKAMQMSDTLKHARTDPGEAMVKEQMCIPKLVPVVEHKYFGALAITFVP